jgi:hypothetical protein
LATAGKRDRFDEFHVRGIPRSAAKGTFALRHLSALRTILINL